MLSKLGCVGPLVRHKVALAAAWEAGTAFRVRTKAGTAVAMNREGKMQRAHSASARSSSHAKVPLNIILPS